MKCFVFLLLVVGLVMMTGCGMPESGDVDAQTFHSIIQDEDVFVLDVHTPEQEHIEGTDATIPFDELESNKKLLPEDKTTPIALYCRSGSMSAKSVETLQNMGYETIYNLEGGRNAYIQIYE